MANHTTDHSALSVEKNGSANKLSKRQEALMDTMLRKKANERLLCAWWNHPGDPSGKSDWFKVWKVTKYKVYYPSRWRKFWARIAVHCIKHERLFWAFQWIATHPKSWANKKGDFYIEYEKEE